MPSTKYVSCFSQELGFHLPLGQGLLLNS